MSIHNLHTTKLQFKYDPKVNFGGNNILEEMKAREKLSPAEKFEQLKLESVSLNLPINSIEIKRYRGARTVELNPVLESKSDMVKHLLELQGRHPEDSDYQTISRFIGKKDESFLKQRITQAKLARKLMEARGISPESDGYISQMEFLSKKDAEYIDKQMGKI
jgi:hypothetical protein